MLIIIKIYVVEQLVWFERVGLVWECECEYHNWGETNLIETKGDTNENQHEHDKFIWSVAGNEWHNW